MDIIKRRGEILLKIFFGLVRIFLYSVIPLFMAMLSVIYVRYVPTVVGDLCGPNGDELCYRPLLQGGFPFAYLIDQGGISGMGQLGIEDKFSALAFGADFLFYVLIVFLIDILIQRSRRRKAG
jgi:hypothetical protein